MYSIPINFRDDQSKTFSMSHHDIRVLLNKLNSNKAPGPDGISGKVLKNCASSIAYPITLLFNMSFSQGQIPGEWKLANVVPVLKKR